MTVLAGQIILADHINGLSTLARNAQTGAGTTTSVTYVSVGTACGTAFTAPASGSVMFDWYSELSTSVTANPALCTVAVREGSVVGSGTSVLAASDGLPLARNDTTTAVSSAAFHPLTGLTPGDAYNVQLEFRSDGTRTLSAGRRGVKVIGLP